MNLKTLFLGALASVGLAGTANAAYVPATWTDTYDVGTGIYVSSGNSHSYFHDITFDGFRPGIDVVESFRLNISWFDDANDVTLWGFDIDPESPNVTLPGYDGDLWVFETLLGGFTIAGWVSLNLTGTLDVTISTGCGLLGLSCGGDFVFAGSELIAKGYSQVAAVPEPSTLGVFGIGLLGIAFASRRRRQS